MTLVSKEIDDLDSERRGAGLSRRYRCVRAVSAGLAAPLSAEDQVVQSMPDASSTKWHLAHTTWFFETFVLAKFADGFRPFHPRFGFLFNSYYNTVGEMYRRPLRGMLSRPSVEEVCDYRRFIDEHIVDLIETRDDDDELRMLITLGLNHEQQHQELLLTDIKHALSLNPMEPAYRMRPSSVGSSASTLQFVGQEHGVVDIGHDGDGFAFDNETPRHQALLRPYALANRLITNGEFRDFIGDDGYRRADLWLSDGWATVNEENWTRPLYWRESLASAFTLAGSEPIEDAAPVCHVSFYEADAFARWAGARLATEFEWECAAAALPVEGNFLDSGELLPRPASAAHGLTQMFGDVWEWTQSAYAPYPGFAPLAGSLGEYNGKFMCNQMVLRGGSCATPADHVRASYRNFFYPHSRWQFSGIRLAKDT